MSEYWVSEGRQWCKYCRIFISSNINQVLQHQSGRKHLNNEENYVREIANKVRATNGSSAAVADQVLAQVAELKQKAEMKARGEEPALVATPASAPAKAPTCVPVPATVALKAEEKEEEKILLADDDVAYPAPAHEAYGPWVEVKTKSEVVDEATDVKEELTTADTGDNISNSRRRIGALDDDDDEEAALRDAERTRRSKVGATQAWDELDAAFKKRGGGMKKRRRRR